MPFAARRVPGDGNTVLEISGTIDPDSAPRLRAALEAAIRSGRPIVIDMGDVTMDSAGVGVLVAAHLQAKRVGVPMLLRTPSGRVRGLVRMLGLDAVLQVEPGTPHDDDDRGQPS